MAGFTDMDPGACNCLTYTACAPCYIPNANLTISWVGSGGPGSATMTHIVSGGVSYWNSPCVNGIGYDMYCYAGQIYIQFNVYSSSACPGSPVNYCANILASSGHILTESSITCSPFATTLTITSASCPALYSLGFTSWTITYP